MTANEARAYKKEALKFQFKKKHGILKYFFGGDAGRMSSMNSHINQSTGQPKYKHSTAESALKEAQRMMRETGVQFNYYKCAYCEGYHIGKLHQPR